MKQVPFPPGWNEERVQDVLNHYEAQTEDEALAEHEAACGREDEPMIAVPADLLPKIREMSARYRAEAEASSA
jgi:hypothetical protein